MHHFIRQSQSVGLAAMAGATLTLGVLSAPAAATTPTRVVYDAGTAFSAAGHNANTFGPWSLWHVSGEDLVSTDAFGIYPSASVDGLYKGISRNEDGSSPYVRVNTSGETQIATNGEEIQPCEIHLLPSRIDYENPSVAIRFTVPEAGWYSALVFVHDLSADLGATCPAGVKVTVRAAGQVLAGDQVSSEGVLDIPWTRHFDYQMPARLMAAGETIEVVVGNKTSFADDSIAAEHNREWSNAYDNTGLRFIVTREAEGAFYDAGVAMTNNMAGARLNPFGTTALGMWYWLYANTASMPSGTSFANWAPRNLSKKLVRLDQSGTRSSSGEQGFGKANTLSSPFFAVNVTSARDADGVSFGELHTHPTASSSTEWPTLRFRPATSGRYSASVVARDISYNGGDPNNSDGVEVFLLVAGNVLTSAVVSAELHCTTAHFEFNDLLLAATEPVDIIVSRRSGGWNDSTAISAIFRRDDEVWDAGRSLAALDWASGSASNPFADKIGGLTWEAGSLPSATSAAFSRLTYPCLKDGGALRYLGFASDANGSLPRIIVPTNGVASLDSLVVTGTVGDTTDPKFRIAPLELWTHPNAPSSLNSCDALRAIVQEDGIYRMRACVRDLSYRGNGLDGVVASLVADGYVADSARVSAEVAAHPWETVLDGGALWLRAGEDALLVIDPDTTDNYNDGTGMSVCFVREGDATAGVLNIDIVADGAGQLSPFAGRGREGWSDATAWNALRLGDAATASVSGCRESCNTNSCRVAVSLTRSSGNAIATDSATSGCSLLNAWAVSSDADDEYVFSVTGLAKNAPYTLYLYSAKGNASGNAVFTVNGMTKSPDLSWFAVTGVAAVVRFETISDATGTISGTFAAKDANGGAFNGLTLVGNLPSVHPFVMVLR